MAWFTVDTTQHNFTGNPMFKLANIPDDSGVLKRVTSMCSKNNITLSKLLISKTGTLLTIQTEPTFINFSLHSAP